MNRQQQILNNQSAPYTKTIPQSNMVVFAATSYHEVRRSDGTITTVFHDSGRHNSHRTISTNSLNRTTNSDEEKR